MSGERCGLPMDVVGYRTICMEPIDHEGPCRPSLSDALREIDRGSRQTSALVDYVCACLAAGGDSE